MALKDHFLSDLDVFINSDDFAETAVIDDVSIEIIRDDDKLKRYQQSNFEGNYKAEIAFYVKKSDISAPVEGQIMDFNNETKRIASVDEEEGVYIIILEEVLS